MKKDTAIKTKEEYVAYVMCKTTGKHMWLIGTQSSTLEGSRKALENHRKEWESYRNELDYNDVQFKHRTVTYTEWEVVG